MDSGISEMLNSVLSNPESLNKLMTIMPVVAQAMNNSGSGGAQPAVEPAPAPAADGSGSSMPPNPAPNDSNTYAENPMSNPEVADALKNLIAALGTTGSANNAAKPAAVPAFAQPSSVPVADDENKFKIEKTLDTLKNFTSATNPESDHKLKLLLALKPFVKDDRKNKIDHAIKYMNAAKIISLFGKNGFV